MNRSLLSRSPAAVLAATLLAVAAPHTLAAQPAPAAARVRATVDSLAQAFLDARSSPGVSIAVVRGTDTLVAKGYGMADLDQRVPATATTLYRIGSITKQFTAASVMRLVEQGKVALDDSIATYVPSLPAAWRGVTVRQLLNHTSGIPSYTDVGVRWQRRWREDMTPDTIVAITAADSVWFAPGSDWRYDNTGYVVLGMLLDHVTGQPYPQYLEQQLLRPLGLEHTWYCDMNRVLPGRAAGYEPGGAEPWRHTVYLSMTQPYAAGSLCSTVGDVARWDRLLATGKVVSAASYRAMTTPEGAAASHHYGFGLGVDTLGGRTMITHGGGIPGFLSENAWFPSESLAVVVLTNSGSGNPGPLLRNVARAALGVPLDRPPTPVALSAAERARYAGRYELALPDGQVLPLVVRATGDAVTITPAGQPMQTLIPFGQHVFGVAADPTVRFTFTVNADRATGLTVLQNGVHLRATRVGDAP